MVVRVARTVSMVQGAVAVVAVVAVMIIAIPMGALAVAVELEVPGEFVVLGAMQAAAPLASS
jgi:hypothetical protein